MKKIILSVGVLCLIGVGLFNPTVLATEQTNVAEMENFDSIAYTHEVLKGSKEKSELWIEAVSIADYSFQFLGSDGNSTAILRNYTGNQTDVVIPREVLREGWTTPSPVVTIGVSAFQSRSLTSVEIPNSITTIEDGAFFYNDLTSVTIPDSVTHLGSVAFSNNQLKEVKLSSALTQIHEGTFIGNHLTTIKVPDSVERIGHMAFAMNELDNVSLPSTLQTMSEEVFFNNPLKNIYCNSIEEATRLIGVLTASVMEGVTELTFLGDSTQILYQLNSLAARVWVPATQQQGFTFQFSGSDGSSEATVTGYTGSARDIEIPSIALNIASGWTHPSPVRVIGERTFQQKGLTNVVLPNSLHTIGTHAFSYNVLTHITIPNSVVIIDHQAFLSNRLESISLSSSLTSIGASSFEKNQLKDVEIPRGVTRLGIQAFHRNPTLTTIYLPPTVTSIGHHAFSESRLKNIYVDSNAEATRFRTVLTPTAMLGANELTILGTRTSNRYRLNNLVNRTWVPFANASDFKFSFTGTDGNSAATITGYTGNEKDIIIPSEVINTAGGWTTPSPVRVIGERAFQQKGLTNVVLPNSLHTIGTHAFSYNVLTHITIPNSVVIIDHQAFLSNRLESISLSSSLTSIGASSFEKNQLKDVEIPRGVTRLGIQAFHRNPTLATIYLPPTVTSIGHHAFGESRLKNIYVDSNAEATRFRTVLTPTAMLGVNELTVLGTRTSNRYRLNNLVNRTWVSY